MTTGFQQQQHEYGPALKAVARPQHIGAKLNPVREPAKQAVVEPASFKPSALAV